MPNLPHFVGGQFGKLNADALNTIVDAVNDLTAKIEGMPNQVTVSGAPRFPIFAQITEAIIDDNDIIRGYAWKEVAWASESLYEPTGKAYDPENPKSPIALPMNGIVKNQRGVEGQYVWLHAANFASGGKAYLLFQENYVSLNFFVGRILNEGGSIISEGGINLYSIERLSFKDGEIQYGGQIYDGYNGTEVLNGGVGGGYSTGTGDCSPIEFPVTIKKDTLVTCIDISSEAGSRLCIFNQANDLAVDCNCSQLLSGTTEEAQQSYINGQNDSISKGTPNYSAERAMQ